MNMEKRRRYPRVSDGEWFIVNTKGNYLRWACCDCGLVHNVDFSVVYDENHKTTDDIGMKVHRNNRSTGQLRRREYGDLQNGKSKTWKMERRDIP